MVLPIWSAIVYNISLLVADLELVAYGADDITASYVRISNTAKCSLNTASERLVAGYDTGR